MQWLLLIVYCSFTFTSLKCLYYVWKYDCYNFIWMSFLNEMNLQFCCCYFVFLKIILMHVVTLCHLSMVIFFTRPKCIFVTWYMWVRLRLTANHYSVMLLYIMYVILLTFCLNIYLLFCLLLQYSIHLKCIHFNSVQVSYTEHTKQGYSLIWALNQNIWYL